MPNEKPWQYNRIECPDCDGVGFINPPTGNNCPACGEPIPLGQKWCEFHKEADSVILQD